MEKDDRRKMVDNVLHYLNIKLSGDSGVFLD